MTHDRICQARMEMESNSEQSLIYSKPDKDGVPTFEWINQLIVQDKENQYGVKENLICQTNSDEMNKNCFYILFNELESEF